MAKISFIMDKGWKRMVRATDHKRFKARVRQHVALATRANASKAVKAIRAGIKAGGFEPNAALTIHVKGSSKPLVDNGDLFKAISFKTQSWDEAFAGVLRTEDSFNIAELIHNGGTIRVTEKMRNMFRILWLVSMGADPSILSGRARVLWERRPRDWRPLRAGTSVIRIPSRPFIEEAFRSSVLKGQMKLGWEKAIERAFRDAAKR